MTWRRSQRVGAGGNRPNAVIKWACKSGYEHCKYQASVVSCGMSPVTEDRILTQRNRRLNVSGKRDYLLISTHKLGFRQKKII